jgi:lipoprotein-releasing system permease protein
LDCATCGPNGAITLFHLSRLPQVLGIALGIVVIITVLSVMNGFHTEVRDRMLRMASHANLIDLHGHLEDWQQAQNSIDHIDQIVAVAPYIEAQAMIVKGRTGNWSSIDGY